MFINFQSNLASEGLDLEAEARNIHRIMSGQAEWTPRDVVTSKACQKTDKCYKAETAKGLLSTMAVRGLGEVLSREKTPFVFKRENIAELNDEQKICNGL